jgi:hypothetical protein
MAQHGMFDASRFDRKPGDPLSVRQFMGETQWHGTDDWGGSWSDAVRSAEVPVHSGTLDAAASRIADVSPTPSGAKYFPVRPKQVADVEVSDQEANLADYDYQKGVAYTDPSDSVIQSSGITSLDARMSWSDSRTENLAALERGVSLPYNNESESIGDTSYVSPADGFETLRDTRDFREMPPSGRRESFTQAELSAQGVFPERHNRWERRQVSQDPRLFEDIHDDGGTRFRGEDLASKLPEQTYESLRRNYYGNLPSNVTAGRHELFEGVRRV